MATGRRSVPKASMIKWEFPRRGRRKAFTAYWYDGGLMPQRHPLLPEDVKLDRGGGVMMVGEKGILMHETYGSNPVIYPDLQLAYTIRVRPEEASAEAVADDAVRLRFVLPPGSYATVLVAALFAAPGVRA